MAIPCKQRLVADPAVGVSDLMGPIETLIQTKDDRNVMKLIAPPPNVKWKSGTPVSWMAALAPLFRSYALIAPNSIISSKKHKQALVRIEEKERINFGKKSISDFSDAVDDIVRMGLQHYRHLKQRPEMKERAFRKADQDQQRAIEGVLALLNVEPDEVGQATEQSPPARSPAQPAASTPNLTAALVPVTSPVHTTSNLTPPSAHGHTEVVNPSSSSTGDAARYEAVFDDILQKYADDDDDDDARHGSQSKTFKITYLSQKKDQSPERQDKSDKCDKSHKEKESPSPVKGAFVLAMSPKDRELLAEAQEAEPVSQMGKTLQQRLNAKKPPKKGKGKGKETKKQKEQEQCEGCTEENKKKKKKKKKTIKNAKDSGNQPKQSGEKDPKVKKRPSQETCGVDPETCPVVLPDYIPTQETMKIPRAVARNRFVSWSYHHTITALKQQGVKDKDALSKAGRRGHSQAGKTFDEAWPRDQPTKQEEKAKTETKTAAKSKAKKKEKQEEKEEERVGASEQEPEKKEEGVETKAPVDKPEVKRRKRCKSKDTGYKPEPWDAD